MKIPLAGGAPVGLAGTSACAGMAVDAANVYWVNDTGEGQVLKVPKKSGGPAVVIASGKFVPIGTAVDDAFVYWIDTSADKVDAIPIGGGAIKTIGGGDALIFGPAAKGGFVYWLDGPGGTVWKASSGGGLQVALAKPEGGGSALAVDATNVYWTTADTVWQTPIAGGMPILLASGQKNPQGIVVDTANVYFVNYAGGTVVRVPSRACFTSWPNSGGRRHDRLPPLPKAVARIHEWGLRARDPVAIAPRRCSSTARTFS